MDEQNSFMTWCMDIFPGETVYIKSDSFGPRFTVRIENSGATDLGILRADAYNPDAAHFISEANNFQTINSSKLGLSGSTIFINNPSEQNGKFKITLLRQN
ncbi:hypothetical protein ACFS7Z_22700 [Pontibacter toksunensis]|uniref:Uncharacterized protein n=1 Tax=Pontibacter toksunensis TaxID=1332631 RepID=A0ABW6C1L5_9BACT